MDTLAEILFPVVEQAKKSIPSATHLEAKADVVLFDDGGLDSLGLVRLIVMVEEEIEGRPDVELTLVSNRAMSRKSSPFATLKTLAEYIEECLEEVGYRG